MDDGSPPSAPISFSRRARRRRSPSGLGRRRAARKRSRPLRGSASQTPKRELAATRAAWAERLGKVEVRTNRPDFDRLVNTWLPYQLYASRLFGRVGPNQRGGATGYRDQLQDVLPLILLEPRLARAQIVLHAASSSSKATCSNGGIAPPTAARASASEPRRATRISGCPTCSARYVAQTGDLSVLDEATPYLEGAAVPG